jgi:addiction module RelE/StbE family toxin
MDTNNYEIILTDTAKEEIEEIYEYISHNLYEKLVANKLMEKIENSFLMLEQNPYICTKVQVKPHNEIYRKLIIDNYIALYEVEEKHKRVIVYRVLYGKMDYLNIVEDV